MSGSFQLIHGDCLKKLKTISENSIDSLVTDPPAGISFMGKDWDSDKGGRDGWIAWMTEVMKECHRVLKPGAHGLVWAIPRTSHWTATALENVGFEIRDVVTHLFGSGFPKSHNISKSIDKEAGAERAVVGHNPNKRTAHKKGARGFDKDLGGESLEEMTLTEPATDLAKQWDGWGTALKPASEHWILIRKPCSEKTVAKNVEKWGVGGINIDASRIEGKKPKTTQGGRSISGSQIGNNFEKEARSVEFDNSKGRFPANLILSHSEECEHDICSLFCPVRMLDEQSGPCKTGALTGQPRVENKTYGKAGATLGKPRFYKPDNATGASRFFYCAKASKKDRNQGLEGFPKKQGGGMCGTENKSLKTGSGNERDGKNQNFHPTVKSTKLMEYLITLITPPNGVVLDPFMGSGSTGLSAVLKGFQFTGIEENHEYLKIAKQRIEFRNEQRL